MSCSNIYDDLKRYASGEHEPCAILLCRGALDEMDQLLDTIRLQQEKIEGLVLENCGLRAQLVSANRMIEMRADAESGKDWFKDRGYA